MTHVDDSTTGEDISADDDVGAERYICALNVYNATNSGTVPFERLEFRFADHGIEFMNIDPSDVRNCLWRNCNTGIWASYSTLSLDNLYMKDVAQTVDNVNGTSYIYYITPVETNPSLDSAPTISPQPQSPANPIPLGQNVTFSVVASGACLTYQWYFNGASVPGATSASYTRYNVQFTNVGPYYVFVPNGKGSFKSSEVSFNVSGPPTILVQPASQRLPYGATARFYVDDRGAGALSYQWHRNGSQIWWATQYGYTTEVLPVGDHWFNVRVSNAAGYTDSMIAYLTITALPESRTYTTQADFENGIRINLVSANDQLSLDLNTTPLPYINVACSGRNTLSRIDVNSGYAVGEYFTTPESDNGNPSRTTVDRYGNVWVGNRDDNKPDDFYLTGPANTKGSLARLGIVIGGIRGTVANGVFSPSLDGQYLKPPFIHNTCIDGDHDGLIRSSRGLGNKISSSSARCVETDGALLFVVDPYMEKLEVISISAEPAIVGQCSLQYLSKDVPLGSDIDIAGQKLYIANERGIEVINIANPSAPVSAGLMQRGSPVTTHDVQYSGNYIYATTDSGLDVFNRTSFQYLATCPNYQGTACGVYGLHVVNNRAYVADSPEGIRILDISNPSYPQVLGGVRLDYNIAYKVKVSGSYAYVAAGGGGLYVVNVSNPYYPTITGNCPAPNPPSAGLSFDVHLYGHYAYLANGHNGLQMINVSNPNSPSIVATYRTRGPVIGIKILGTYALLAEGFMGVEILNLANPANPTSHGSNRYAGDDALLNYVRVEGVTVRHVSVDKDNNVWVGGYDNRVFEKVDSLTGLVVIGSRFPAQGDGVYGCYGGFIDAYNCLWSATYQGVGGTHTYILKRNLTTGQDLTTYSAFAVGHYGLSIRPQNQEVWITSSDQSQITRYSNGGDSYPGSWIANYPHGNLYAQGSVIDINGDVWIAHQRYIAEENGNKSQHMTVGHMKSFTSTNSAVYVGNVCLSINRDAEIGPTGVAVDTNAKVWVSNWNANSLMRINPNGGPLNGGYRVGAVDLIVPLGDNANPYNYSDMTGFVLKSITDPAGSWIFVHDGGLVDRAWLAPTWLANTPPQFNQG